MIDSAILEAMDNLYLTIVSGSMPVGIDPRMWTDAVHVARRVRALRVDDATAWSWAGACVARLVAAGDYEPHIAPLQWYLTTHGLRELDNAARPEFRRRAIARRDHRRAIAVSDGRPIVMPDGRHIDEVIADARDDWYVPIDPSLIVTEYPNLDLRPAAARQILEAVDDPVNRLILEHFAEGMTSGQIGELVHLSPAAVRKRISRMKVELRKVPLSGALAIEARQRRLPGQG